MIKMPGWPRPAGHLILNAISRQYDAVPCGIKRYRNAIRLKGRPIGQSRSGYMDWVILVIAGLFETGWAIGLKYTHGFTRLWPSVWTVLAMGVSLWLLGIAIRSLPVGTAYSVWVGIGAIGTVILGIVLFGEPANSGRLISIALIVAGIIGLKLAA